MILRLHARVDYRFSFAYVGPCIDLGFDGSNWALWIEWGRFLSFLNKSIWAQLTPSWITSSRFSTMLGQIGQPKYYSQGSMTLQGQPCTQLSRVHWPVVKPPAGWGMANALPVQSTSLYIQTCSPKIGVPQNACCQAVAAVRSAMLATAGLLVAFITAWLTDSDICCFVTLHPLMTVF